MKRIIVVLMLLVTGCAQIALIPVFIGEKTEALIKKHPTTRPWHFEKDKVVFDDVNKE